MLGMKREPIVGMNNNSAIPGFLFLLFFRGAWMPQHPVFQVVVSHGNG